jgi:Fe(3+) dicitrate transport protein
MSQTIQAGIRYEYQDMTNRNFLGLSGQILEDGDQEGLTIFERNLQANTVSAFLQSDIKAARDFHVVPGVRFEWYNVKRDSFVVAVEEGEAEEPEDAGQLDDCNTVLGTAFTDDEECRIIEGIERGAFSEKYDSFNVLPGVAFAYNGFYRTTLFGGYHRGLSTGVLRNEDFPAPDEIGDNFQVGVRSTAIKGVAFEVAGFHQRLQDFQYGSTFSAAGDRSFGRADEVRINGVELAGRLNSRPFTGGPFNVYGESNYTYNRAVIEKGTALDEDGLEEDVSGNRVPEVPWHLAALTLGVENHAGWRWDASVTWTYRGAFFTDEFNTAFGGNAEGEVGEVPSVWLLSARFNLDIGDTGASMYVAGTNLTDEFYITDREDGLKPGLGRTIWTGFKYKF